MSGTGQAEREPPSKRPTARARHGVERAETGDVAGVNELDRTRQSNPATTEAVEQEASDGPEGRGMSR